MDLAAEINRILSNDSLDSDECEESKCETIEGLIPLHGWEAVQGVLLNILLDDERDVRDYEVAAEVFWGAILDKRLIHPQNRVIALLYHRLQIDTNSENNLVWSIVCKLKNVDYLSDYNPLNDQAIAEEIKFLEARRFERRKVKDGDQDGE